jgi:hypothetical protein
MMLGEVCYASPYGEGGYTAGISLDQVLNDLGRLALEVARLSGGPALRQSELTDAQVERT